MDSHKREIWFAVAALVVALVLLVCTGFSGYGFLGLTITIGGIFDFFFTHYSVEGYVANEVYGEPGEELWRFRSFILMVGGPFVSLFGILFT